MTLSDFTIGCIFWTGTGPWRCTDIGTRTIIAVDLYDDDGDDIAGRAESVFDEDEMAACYPTAEEYEADIGCSPSRRPGSAFKRHEPS